jgi:adenosylmethionine-8-amino-7-oxononanoate aminotransferase
MSFQYWVNKGNKNKTKFVSFYNAYHGDTIGTMSISGVGQYNNLFSPLFFKSFKVKSPNELELLLKRKSKEICAIIVEPLLMAAGGMIIYSKENLTKIGKLAEKYNVHLIVDEVATGFGRTGKMFACEYTDIKPDFMCLSKGITAGYLPLGATLTTNKIYNAFYDDYEKQKTFYHGHTYTANPLSCSAAVASLEIFEKENTLSNMRKIIPLFREKLFEFNKYYFVKNVRHIGFVGAMDIVSKRKRIGLEIYKEGLKNNLILRPLGNIIYLFLPLCVRKKDLDSIFKKMHKVFMKIKARVS